MRQVTCRRRLDIGASLKRGSFATAEPTRVVQTRGGRQSELARRVAAVVEARVLRRVRHAPHTESVQCMEGGMNELCLRACEHGATENAGAETSTEPISSVAR